jgi:hypothetical protein
MMVQHLWECCLNVVSLYVSMVCDRRSSVPRCW